MKSEQIQDIVIKLMWLKEDIKIYTDVRFLVWTNGLSEKRACV